jgi:hypothetical protein
LEALKDETATVYIPSCMWKTEKKVIKKTGEKQQGSEKRMRKKDGRYIGRRTLLLHWCLEIKH